jgi:OmpA-OmpF porin, OOP family
VKQLIVLFVFLINLVSFSQDVEKCQGVEPSYINRIPGFDISDCENSDYFEYAFQYNVGSEYVVLKKAGRYQEIWYKKNPTETRKFSSTQIVKNYADAIRKIDGKVLADDNSVMTASIDGKEVYIHVYNSKNTDENQFYVRIIEVAIMKQDIVININEAIDKDGKVALYGILFDTNKSTIKPESEEALKQIVDYLNTNTKDKIIIVGHTDNTGDYSGNIKLSKERAESVKNYLVKEGRIDASRLKTEGAGQFCPATTNSSEEGRKLNRRVELVKF